MIYVSRPDGTVIGKFTEAEFLAKASAGEISREDFYLNEPEQVWRIAAEYPGAVFGKRVMPPPLPAGTGKRSNKAWKITALVVGGFAALVVLSTIEERTRVFSGVFNSLFALALGLIALAIVVCWVAFPIIVLSKFNELLDMERKSLDQQRENAKALQSILSGSKHGV
jgi:hypothetical protein